MCARMHAFFMSRDNALQTAQEETRTHHVLADGEFGEKVASKVTLVRGQRICGQEEGSGIGAQYATTQHSINIKGDRPSAISSLNSWRPTCCMVSSNCAGEMSDSARSSGAGGRGEHLGRSWKTNTRVPTNKRESHPCCKT